MTVQRFTSAYTPWMLQRPLAVYDGLDASARAAVDRAFAGTGCETLWAHRPRHRVGKRRFTLVLERAEP